MEFKPWLACIAKENYDYYCEILKKTHLYHNHKKKVIFGAGIIGIQLSYILRNSGEKEFVFCDNNPQKWNTRIADIDVVSPKLLCGNQDIYYVFVAMEKYQDCVQELEQMGYMENENYIKIFNCSENLLADGIMINDSKTTLFLGDCIMNTVSIFEEDKTSLRDLFEVMFKNVKVLSLNGMTMRMYYVLLQIVLKYNKSVDKVVLFLDTSIFQDKYHLYPAVQHPAVLERIISLLNPIDDECEKLLNDMKNRSLIHNQLSEISPDRSVELDETEIDNIKKLHMRLNFLYHIKENTESMNFLDKFVECCESLGLEVFFLILPVNYEEGKRFWNNDFYSKYETIRDTIISHCGKDEVIDASYLLKRDNFLSIRSTNEGLNRSGREKLSNFLYDFLNK